VKEITKRARTLRNNLTDTERRLWSRLKREQINGYKFRRQFPLGPFIVDFVCLEARLIVEVDGGQHAEQRQKDEQRDKWLASQNFHVLRFWDNDVLRETDAVVEAIVQALKNTPTPSLPRKGGGSKGFTLIEVAVVMLVIVIVLGIVSVNLEPDRETPVRDEARRMVLLLKTAQQESILQGKILAVAIERQGYYFLMLNDNNEFRPMDGDEVLRARPLPSGIVISMVDIDGMPDTEETETPRLILLPTGELSPFTVIFSRGDVRWRVEGALTGEITAQTVAPAEKA
jgi:type II secretion system protein H